MEPNKRRPRRCLARLVLRLIPSGWTGFRPVFDGWVVNEGDTPQMSIRAAIDAAILSENVQGDGSPDTNTQPTL